MMGRCDECGTIAELFAIRVPFIEICVPNPLRMLCYFCCRGDA